VGGVFVAIFRTPSGAVAFDGAVVVTMIVIVVGFGGASVADVSVMLLVRVYREFAVVAGSWNKLLARDRGPVGLAGLDIASFAGPIVAAPSAIIV